MFAFSLCRYGRFLSNASHLSLGCGGFAVEIKCKVVHMSLAQVSVHHKNPSWEALLENLRKCEEKEKGDCPSVQIGFHICFPVIPFL